MTRHRWTSTTTPSSAARVLKRLPHLGRKLRFVQRSYVLYDYEVPYTLNPSGMLLAISRDAPACPCQEREESCGL